MTLILDAGALVALERGSTEVVAEIGRELKAGRSPRTHGGVVSQVWRGGSGRQAWLARHLRSVEVIALDDRLGKRAGELLGRSRTSDIVDAALVAITDGGDVILTSDADDLLALVDAAGVDAVVVPV